MKSSPSTSTPTPLKFTATEEIWLASLPDDLLKHLSDEEAAVLVRKEEEDWPEALKRKVAPYIEMDNPPE